MDKRERVEWTTALLDTEAGDGLDHATTAWRVSQYLGRGDVRRMRQAVADARCARQGQE